MVEHTGPLFTISGSLGEDKPNLVFTAGSEVFLLFLLD